MKTAAIVVLFPILTAIGYRSEPFSDSEMEEMKSVISELYPGAITTIGGASKGCGCAEGPACTSESKVSVLYQEKQFGLTLSRINGRWGIGQYQKWELKWQSRQICNRPVSNVEPEVIQAYHNCLIAETLLLESRPKCPEEYNFRAKAAAARPTLNLIDPSNDAPKK